METDESEPLSWTTSLSAMPSCFLLSVPAHLISFSQTSFPAAPSNNHTVTVTPALRSEEVLLILDTRTLARAAHTEAVTHFPVNLKFFRCSLFHEWRDAESVILRFWKMRAAGLTSAEEVSLRGIRLQMGEDGSLWSLSHVSARLPSFGSTARPVTWPSSDSQSKSRQAFSNRV